MCALGGNGPAVMAAGLFASSVSRFVFPYLSDNHDEAVYLQQAEALRAGRLTLAAPLAPPASSSFTPWLAKYEAGRYLFKYTPVHAALLAAGRTLTGSYRLSLALIAMASAGAFALLAREVLGDRVQSTVALWCFVLSPMFIVISGTYLSYVSSLLWLQLVALGLLRARRGAGWGWHAFAGAAGGLAVFNRPFDAVVFGAPFALAFMIRGVRRPGVARSVGAIALGAAPPLGVLALFDRHVTGSALRLPFSLLDPLDAVGFGERRIVPDVATVRFGVPESLLASWLHLLSLAVFVCGGPTLMVLAAGRLRRACGSEWLVAATAVTVPVGYFFFWGPYNVSALWDSSALPGLGPFYWMPVLVPLAVLGGAGLVDVARSQRALAAVIVAVMAVVTSLSLGTAFRHDLDATARAERLQAPVIASRADASSAGAGRIVFLPPMMGFWLLHPFTMLRNTPGHDGPDIYATARGRADFDVLDGFPTRLPFRVDVVEGRQSVVVGVTALRTRSADVEVTVRTRPLQPHVALQVIHAGRRSWFVLGDGSATATLAVVRLRLTPEDVVSTDASGGTLRPSERTAAPADLPFTVSAVFSARADFGEPAVVEYRMSERTTAGLVELLLPGTGHTMRSDGAWVGWQGDDLAVSVAGGA